MTSPSHPSIRRQLIPLACLIAATVAPAPGQTDDFEQAPIHYSESTATDPVASWQKRIQEKSLHFDHSSERAFLRDVLEELDVPIESQVLVYSKTSLQIDRISPRRPRAIYFSEDAYVGWVQGGDIEIISMDPDLGPIFYKMTVPYPEAAHPPRVLRSRDCLSCHEGSRTGQVPGMLIRSVRPDVRGFPLLKSGTFLSDHSSPLSERWGGWYVTGSNAGSRHMGNLLYEETDAPNPRVIKDMGNDLTVLDEIIDTKSYLRGTSDIVALMVLEHQAAVHNAITAANFTTRRMLYHHREMAKYWGDDDDGMSDTTKRVIASRADHLLRTMLFTDEFDLESWGVEGDEAFQTAFQRNARRSADGRSLKDFDLLSHLFEHRLSYMIYSKSFDALPSEVKEVFYEQLFAALDDPEAHEVSRHLTAKEARRIKRILLETKDGIPSSLAGT